MTNHKDIIGALSAFKGENVFNPWRDVDPLDLMRSGGVADRGRRWRLERHFDCKPKFLLVGEAPGYQGCHFSGVPFTNEKLILEGMIPRVIATGRITTREKPWSEPSATIVWRTLHELGIAEHTVMWNAFAFHPHKPGEPMSNRAPTKAELQAGSKYLRSVLMHFKGAPVVAVGMVAYTLLTTLGVSILARVRHPSMGGAAEFRDGLRQLVTIKEKISNADQRVL